MFGRKLGERLIVRFDAAAVARLLDLGLQARASAARGKLFVRYRRLPTCARARYRPEGRRSIPGPGRPANPYLLSGRPLASRRPR
jgi:hypothetical protein